MRPISSDFYDTLRQRNTWWADPREENKSALKASLRARLRFDYLFAPSISLGRAEVLDGALFMLTSPVELRRWLAIEEGAPSPITILTRSGRLDEDLLDWARPDVAGDEYPEMFFVVAPNLQQHLSAELQRSLPSDLSDWRTLADAIGSAVGRDTREQLLDYWGKWIAEAGSVLRVAKFLRVPDYRPFLQETHCDWQALYGLAPSSEAARQAQTLYQEAFKVFEHGGWRRTPLTRFLEREARNAGPFAAQVVTEHFNIAIGRARAVANDSDHETITALDFRDAWLDRNAVRLLTNEPHAEDTGNLAQIALPLHIGEWLVDCDYQKLMTKVRPYRRAWLRTGNEDNLMRLAEAIADEVVKAPGSLPMAPSAGTVQLLRYVLTGFGAGGAVTLALNGPPWTAVASALGSFWAAQTKDFGLKRIVEDRQHARVLRQFVQTVRPRLETRASY